MKTQRKKHTEERQEMADTVKYYEKEGPPAAVKFAKKTFEGLVNVQTQNLTNAIKPSLVMLLDIYSKEEVLQKLKDLLNRITVEEVMNS